jgi:putative FmdB family regulatory protein
MPTYTYKCKNGHVHEEFRSMSNRNTPSKCFCGAMAERTMSGNNPSFVFARQPGESYLDRLDLKKMWAEKDKQDYQGQI